MTKFAEHEIVYCHREILTYSFEGRPMEMITLTSNLGRTDEVEETIEGLYPDNNRPNKFKGKRTIFISSRVHPGETPASFVLTGLLNFLTNLKSKQA